MTTTSTPLVTPGVVEADDILYANGGMIRQRGAVKLHETPENGFPSWRQHNGGEGGLRPMLTIGGYPRGLHIFGVGKDTSGAGANTDPQDSTKTGYGWQNHSGGAYCNLSRDREDVVISDSYHFGLFAERDAGALSEIHWYCDTQGWKVEPKATWKRSFLEVKMDLLNGTLSIMGSDGNYHMVDSNANLPGFNQNKANQAYFRMTYVIRDSYTSDSHTFSGYVELQVGGKTYDVRDLGAESAKVTAQAVDSVTGGGVGSSLMESFRGGRNPGIGVVTPIANRTGGVIIYDHLETIDDKVVGFS